MMGLNLNFPRDTKAVSDESQTLMIAIFYNPQNNDVLTAENPQQVRGNLHLLRQLPPQPDIIHIFCIPLIAATLIAMFSYIPFSFQVGGYVIGMPHIFVGLALLYYCTVGIFAALIMGVAFGVGHLAWVKAFEGVEPQSALKWIIAIHVVSWVMQFVGHGVFEKRKPALLDNIFQIFSAPLFVIIELFDLVGVRTKEVEEWKVEVERKVAQFHGKSA